MKSANKKIHEVVYNIVKFMVINPDAQLAEAEHAIREVVGKYRLDFAELSPTMRELLGAAYIRGGIDTLNKIKDEQKKSPDK